MCWCKLSEDPRSFVDKCFSSREKKKSERMQRLLKEERTWYKILRGVGQPGVIYVLLHVFGEQWPVSSMRWVLCCDPRHTLGLCLQEVTRPGHPNAILSEMPMDIEDDEFGEMRILHDVERGL